jgi:hypothetical protein
MAVPATSATSLPERLCASGTAWRTHVGIVAMSGCIAIENTMNQRGASGKSE